MNRITISPLSFLLLAASIEYERAVSDNASWYVGPQVSFAGAVSRELLGVDTVAVDLTTGVRFFPVEGALAPKGFWLGPEGRFSYVSLSSDDGSSARGIAFSLLCAVGYTFVADGGFTISMGAAAGAGVTNVQLPGSPDSPVGPAFGVHVNLGYGF
jgi:hypothetical protein